MERSASSRSDAHRVAASARSATESTESRTASLADVIASVARSATWSVAARAWSAILETLGLDELLTPDALVMVEWGEKFKSIRKKATGEIAIASAGGDARKISVTLKE